MRFYKPVLLIGFLTLAFGVNETVAQLDTIHRIPPMHSRLDSEIDDHHVYLSTPVQSSFQVTITDGSGNPIPASPVSVSNNNPRRIQVGVGQSPGTELMVPSDSLNKPLDSSGLILQAGEEFYANARYRTGAQAASLTSKGTEAEGTTFRVNCMPIPAENPTFLGRNFVTGIMATRDGTTVDVSDYDAGVVFHGPNNVTQNSLTLNLDSGECYVLSGYTNVSANLEGFVGALIESNHPIVVNSGNYLGSIHSTFGQDIGIDQIVPFDNVGQNYAVVEANGPDQQERPMVVAHEDNTEVYVNGSATPDATLNGGEYYLVPNADYDAGPNHSNMFINTSKPAYVSQFLAGDSSDFTTPGMNFLAPLNCGLPQEVDLIPDIDSIGSTGYEGEVIIFVEKDSVVFVNGFPQLGGKSLPGNNNWETFRIDSSGGSLLQGDVSVNATGAMAVAFFGASGLAGYGGIYSGFDLKVEADFEFENTISVASEAVTCPQDTVTIPFVGASQSSSNFTWDFGGGTVISGTGSGPYQVRYDNAGKDTVSLTVGVSSCNDNTEKVLEVYDPEGGKGELSNVSVKEDSIVEVVIAGGSNKYVDAYELQRKKGGGNFKSIDSIEAPSNPGDTFVIEDSTGTTGSRLCYRVLTYRPCTVTMTSDTFCAIQLSGTARNESNQLTWEGFKGYGLDSQYVLRQSVSGYDTIARIGGGDTSYKDSGLYCNVAQTYKVEAYEGGGERVTLSDTTTLTPFDTTRPLPPGLNQASVKRPDSVLISFDTSSSITVDRYVAYRSENNGTYQAFDTISAPSGERKTIYDTGISPAANTYCYYLKSVDSCSDVVSAPSDTHCLIALSGTPGNLSSKLAWYDYEGFPVDAYSIEKEVDGNWQPLDTLSSSDTSYVDSRSLRCNRPYEYRIRGFKAGDTLETISGRTTVVPFDTIPPPDVNIRNATVQNNDSIRLTFDTVKDIDVAEYIIEAKSGSGSYSQVGSVSDNTDSLLSFTHTGINPEKEQYCYQVLAIDSCSGQVSSASETHCPVLLSGDSLNLGNLLTWKAYEGYNVGRYVIERHQSGSRQAYDTVPGSDTSYKDSGLACNKPYHYRIKAEEQGSLNSISYSDSLTLVPYDTIDPAVPGIHYAKVTGDSSTELSWTPSSGDVDRYGIYRDDGLGSFKAIDTVEGREDTTYTDSLETGVGRSYCYRVTAIDSCSSNESGKSDQHCTIFLTSNTVECIQEVNLNWNGYEGFDSVSHYKVYRQKDSGSLSLLTTLDSGSRSYTDTQVRFPHEYCYQVRAFESNGDDSSVSNGSCDAPFEPNTPYVKSAGKTVTDEVSGSVKVSWENQQGEPELHYQKLYYRDPATSDFSLLKDSIPLNTDSFVHSGLNTKTANHRYYVTTLDSCGNESDSIGIHTTMDLEFEVGQLLHELSWTPYEGWPVARYEVQRFRAGTFNTIDTLLGSDTFQARYPEPCNFPISYRIKAVDSQGNYAYSDSVKREAIDTLNPDRTTQKNLTVLNDSVVEVTYSGADSSDIFAYDLMRQRGGGNFQLAEREIFNSPGGTFTVTDTTDAVGDQLCYAVLTQDSCLNTVSSDTFCATNLQGEAKNLGNALTWKRFEGYPIDSQYVMLANAGGGYDTLARLGGTKSSYTHSPLPCNIAHRYRIVSYEAGGNRETKSNNQLVIPFDTLKPDAPDLRQATVKNSDSISIKWDTSSDRNVDRYEVFYSVRGDTFQSAGIVDEQDQALNEFSHDTISTAPFNQSYCYYLEAIDSCSDVHSVPSDTHCVIEVEAEGGQRETHLTWQGYEGGSIARYVIERNEGGGVWQDLDTVTAVDTSYTDSNEARCGITYNYRIRGEWNDGLMQTSLSDTAKGTPFDTVKPEKAFIESFSIEGPASAEVIWQLSDGDVNNYELWLKSANGSWENKDTVGVQTSYTFGGLSTLDSQYCTRVVAIDSCRANRSGFSVSHCGIQLSGAPGQKENHLDWSLYEGWDSTAAYYLYNKTQGNWQPLDTLKGTTSSYTHSGIPCNRPQHYKVEGKSGKGFTALSDSLTLTPIDTIAPDGPGINNVTVKNPDTIAGTFDTAKALDVEEYVIYAKSGISPYQAVDTIADTGQSLNRFVHTGIRPDTAPYCYRVRSIDSCSGNVSAFGEKGCPVELKGRAGNLKAELNWHAYESLFNATYEVERKEAGSSWQRIGSKTDTSLTDTQAMACNETYTYRIMSISPTGTDTSYSDTVNVQPFDTTTPEAPVLRYASSDLNGSMELEWNWPRGSNQKYFEVWRDQGGGNYALEGTVTYDSQYRDGGATPKQTAHGYYIRAIDSCAGDGTVGAPGNRSLPSDTDRIMVPEVATGACSPEARLNWTPYSDLPGSTDYYRVHRRDSNNSSFKQVAAVSDTTHVDSTILEETNYCYRIEAVDTQSGYSAFSDSLCMAPFVYPDPHPGDMVRATVSETGTTTGKIALTWERSPVSDQFARGYHLYHRTGNGPFKQIADIIDLDDTTHTHTGINTEDSLHSYYVRIYNRCDVEGMPSDTHRVINLRPTNDNLAIRLKWTPYEGFEVGEYEVYRSVNGGAKSVIGTFSAGDTAYIDSNVRCQQDYSYEVKAYDQRGNVVSWSDSQEVTSYDSIPPTGTAPNSASVLQTGEEDGIVELIFDGSSETNRRGYYVYRGTDGGTFKPIDTIETDQMRDLTYRDEELNTKGVGHSYYLRAFDSCDNVAVPSDTHSTIYLEATPRNHYNELDWRGYRGWGSGHEYVVQRRQGTNAWQTIATLDSDRSSYEDSNVRCQEVYDYRILGQEEGTVYAAYSNRDTALAFEDDAPAAPEVIRATVTGTGSNEGSTEITWYESPSVDVAAYVIERKKAGSVWNRLDTTRRKAYRDSNLNTKEEAYWYRVKGLDSCDNLSEEMLNEHLTIHLEAEGGNEVINLTWNGYRGRKVDSYRVMKYGEVIKTLDGDDTAYTDRSVLCDSVYEYKVEAMMGDTSVIVASSNEAGAAPFDTRPPQRVYLQSASVAAFNDVVKLEWSESPSNDAFGYAIYRQPEPEGSLVLVGKVAGKATTVYYDSLSEEPGDLCYRVRTLDYCENKSVVSNAGCVIEPELRNVDGAFRNELSWPRYRNWRREGQQYTVYKAVDSGEYDAIGTTHGDKRRFTDHDLSDTVEEFCYYIEARGNHPKEVSKSLKRCVSQEAVVHMANSFTPGITEGVNDKFGPKGVFIKNYEMQIFNRWGERIYETQEGEGWDGRYEGALVPEGVYTYVIRVVGFDGEEKKYKGTLTVIR